MRFLEDRPAINAMGREIGPQTLAAAQALYRAEQDVVAQQIPLAHADLAYGPDPRHRLDLYRPVDTAKDSLAPIFVWVHGGGFIAGAKRAEDNPYNAHAGRFAARHGFLGAVINYRLAPQHGWPAGAEDVGRAIDWLIENAAQFGGDPERIVLVGTSAGATHVATHLKLRLDAPRIRAAVMLSGLYGFTAAEDKQREGAYYGFDPEAYAARVPGQALVETTTPLMLCCSEFDPIRFQIDFSEVLRRRIDRHGRIPRAWIGNGHNHYTLAYHIGSSDTRLTDELLAFARESLA